MNGAELIMKTAKKAGVEVCFTNFGTSENPLALSFDSEPGVRPVLGLFEGVCTGAADGWGRVMDRPAMTLLHLGPGLANGTANLHNARKGRTPLINLIGEHTSEYKHIDSPLSMSIEPLAAAVSGWYKTSTSASALSQDMAEAWAASMYGQIATLIVPTDFQGDDVSGREVGHRSSRSILWMKERRCRCQNFRTYSRVGLLLGGRALRGSGLKIAARIQSLTGCDLLANHVPPYVERGPDFPYVIQLPYFAEAQLEIISQYQAVVLAGAIEPTCFFGFPGLRSHLLPDNQPRAYLVPRLQSVVEALESLADSLKGSSGGFSVNIPTDPPVLPRGELTAEKACQAVASFQPENAIIVDEAVSSGFQYYNLSKSSRPHSLITIAGGATGWGLPCSTGAAIAGRGRPVIDIQADGCAMYTVQALWTQAREKLNIITLICANRRYNILKLQLDRANLPIGPGVHSLIDLENPTLDWVKIAGGLGVPGVSVSTVEGLVNEYHKAAAEPGPHVIEMVTQLAVNTRRGGNQ
jgi:acetolactate synthase-1/2/3 large subunit